MYEVGQILAGKYRVDHQLGEGGMGIVLAATHMHLGTQVALKLLRQDMAQGTVVDRFLREARASATLRSEHVCKVSDVGVLEDGVPFIVMEMLVGSDLQTILRANGPMPVSIVAEYILQACIGVAEAHALGIVHRDLKPGNLMWTQRPDGTNLIKVLDFGVAKAPEALNFSLTQTSNIIGSPGYMSPEQLKSSKEVDARSDIWSLGIVLYELVSGRPPWNGESITELALRVAMDVMPPLVGMGPFEMVITRCLEKDPARRFQNVAELAAALAPFAGLVGQDLATAVSRVLYGSRAQQHTPMPPSARGASTPTTLGSASGVMRSAPAVPARRTWKLPAVIGVGTAAAVIGVVVALGSGAKPGMQVGVQPTQPTTSTTGPTVTPITPTPITPTPTPAIATPTPTPAIAPIAPTPTPTPTPTPVETKKPVELKKPELKKPELKKPVETKKPVEIKKPVVTPPVIKPKHTKPEDPGESRT